MNFVKSVIAHIFAVFKYFAEQIIYFDFSKIAYKIEKSKGRYLK